MGGLHQGLIRFTLTWKVVVKDGLSHPSLHANSERQLRFDLMVRGRVLGGRWKCMSKAGRENAHGSACMTMYSMYPDGGITPLDYALLYICMYRYKTPTNLARPGQPPTHQVVVEKQRTPPLTTPHTSSLRFVYLCLSGIPCPCFSLVSGLPSHTTTHPAGAAWGCRSIDRASLGGPHPITSTGFG